MICGRCHDNHATVDEVRKCYESARQLVDPDIPEGYYAVDSLTGNNDVDFFCVDKPEKGQWAGHVFVKQIVGGDQWFPCKGRRKYEVLEAITRVGWNIAGERFAAERKECYKCLSDLTKYASRSLGLGRTCAGKCGLGELWDHIQREWEAAEREDTAVKPVASKKVKIKIHGEPVVGKSSLIPSKTVGN